MAVVLIVDDGADARNLLARVLRYAGYQTACADGGAEALRAIDAARPDLVLLDVNMPDVDGFDVLAALAARLGPAAPPVIMLTAQSDPASRDRAAALGARDYFVKASFDLGAMLDAIRRHVAA